MGLGQLPPGARGYLIGEQLEQQRQAQGIGQLGQIINMGGHLQQQQFANREMQDRALLSQQLGSIPEIANHPVLSALARSRPEMLLPLVMPKPKGERVLAPGATLLGSDDKPIFQAPFAPKEAPKAELTKLLEDRDRLPPGDPNRSFYDAKIKRLTTSEKAPTPWQIVTGADGKMHFVDTRNPQAAAVPVRDAAGETVGKPEKALNESQSNATMFGIRAVDMDKTLQTLEAAGYDPTSVASGKDRMTAGNVLTNWAASPEGQKYMNAGRNFVAATLRKESGATITESEWKYGQELYIPMPGDVPDMIKQKKNNRDLVIKGLREAAGPGGSRIPTTFAGGPAKKVKRTGTYQGKKVIEYDDGTIETQ